MENAPRYKRLRQLRLASVLARGIFDKIGAVITHLAGAPAQNKGVEEMIVVNTDFIAGYSVAQTLGLVQGSSVRAKHVGRDFAAGLKSIFGGELKGYTELLNESRQQAMARMIAAVHGIRARISSVTVVDSG